MGNQRILISFFFLLALGCAERKLDKPFQNTAPSTPPPVPISNSVLKSCAEIKARDTASKDGAYTIDPDGSGARAAFSVYCDMSTDGGGWTLIRKTDGTATYSLVQEGDEKVSLLSSISLDGNAQLASIVVNQLGNVLMAKNIPTNGTIWFDRTKLINGPDCDVQGSYNFKWNYDPNGATAFYCPKASSIFPPSANRWGEKIQQAPYGSTVINYALLAHSLCFGSFLDDISTPGHYCLHRENGTDGFGWWNFGSGGPDGINNSHPQVLLFVR